MCMCICLLSLTSTSCADPSWHAVPKPQLRPMPFPCSVSPQQLEAAARALLARCQAGLVSPVSYNALLTRRTLMLVPRRQEASGPVAVKCGTAVACICTGFGGQGQANAATTAGVRYAVLSWHAAVCTTLNVPTAAAAAAAVTAAADCAARLALLALCCCAATRIWPMPGRDAPWCCWLTWRIPGTANLMIM
jgi:ATP adenylyltransferase C-terminal domain